MPGVFVVVFTVGMAVEKCASKSSDVLSCRVN
jgi:hypothetical protein